MSTPFEEGGVEWHLAGAMARMLLVIEAIKAVGGRLVSPVTFGCRRSLWLVPGGLN